MMKLKLLTVLAGAVVALPAMAADVTYRNDMAPLLKKYCAECHAATADAPSMAEFKLDEEKYKKAKVGPRSDTYEHLLQLVNGNSTGAFMRRLDDGTNPYAKEGKPGNMYKYLGETEAERAANFKIVNAWVVGEGNKWDMNGIGQRGDMPPITLEQLRRMKLKY
ncbi:cytochrome C [Rhodoferax sp.]|uniref:cytochrome C n=1 Tax=Rhodoferax sp. TaxID=50421 RepID=UPI0025DB63F8|nr:cytochrome C [Rhodoferax sp.]